MAKSGKEAEPKQEEQAAAEERDELQEVQETPEVSTDKVAEDNAAEEEAAEKNAAEDDSDAEQPHTTKAGKHSAKAQREADAEIERKQAAATKQEEEPVKPKTIIQRPNPLNQHGKAYRAAAELVDRTKLYELTEAVDLVKQTAKTKFDATIELHVNLGVDPRQADQMVRATVVLPAGTGKKLRIAVLSSSDKHAAATKAGATIVSDGDLIAKIEKGELNFDILIAAPDMMAQLAKVAKVLGPRNLMPNPKSGTVTANVVQAVEQAQAGQIEFRIDKQAIVHLAIGKASFTTTQLEDNTKAAVHAILRAKPSAAKGTYINAISLTSSMGPGIKLDVQKTIAEANPKR